MIGAEDHWSCLHSSVSSYRSIHFFSSMKQRVEFFSNAFYFLSHVFTHHEFFSLRFALRIIFLSLNLSIYLFYTLRWIHISTSHFQWVSMVFSWNLNVVDARTFETTKTTNRFFFINFFLFRSQLYSFYLFVCFEWIKIRSFESFIYLFFWFDFACTGVFRTYDFLFDEFSYSIQCVLPFRIASLFSFIVDYNIYTLLYLYTHYSFFWCGAYIHT